MAYRIKVDVPLEKSFRRIGEEQFEMAERRLIEDPNVEIAVHSARKAVKRLRAMLRLVRPGMAAGDFKRENERLRDIGRAMAQRRDEDVLRETVAKLMTVKSVGKLMPESFSDRLGAVLEARRSEARQTMETVRVAKALGKARRKFEQIALDIDTFDVVADGVAQTYGKGQSAYGMAMVSPTVEHIHDFRKSVQRHWRHMQLISPLWPQVFKARAGLAREISELLGRDHDIAAVMVLIEDECGTLGIERVRARLVKACAKQQFQLRQSAWVRAEVLYGGEARHWRRVLPKYWRSARRMTDDAFALGRPGRTNAA